MDGVILSRWAMEWDMKIKAANVGRQLEDYRIAVFLDSAGQHTIIEEMQKQLHCIRFIRLPKNTTSFLQPLDAGIIRSVKAHYRRRLLTIYINAYREGSDTPKIEVLHAILLIAEAWDDVTPDTIRNCWAKTEILPVSETADIRADGEGRGRQSRADAEVEKELSDMMSTLGMEESACDFIEAEERDPIPRYDEGATYESMANEVLAEIMSDSSDGDDVDYEEKQPGPSDVDLAEIRRGISGLELFYLSTIVTNLGVKQKEREEVAAVLKKARAHLQRASLERAIQSRINFPKA